MTSSFTFCEHFFWVMDPSCSKTPTLLAPANRFFLDAWLVRCFLGNSSQPSFASGTTTNKNASLAISLSC